MFALPAWSSAALQSVSRYVSLEVHGALANFGLSLRSTSPLRDVNATAPSVYGNNVGAASCHFLLPTLYLWFFCDTPPLSTARNIQ